MFGFGATLATEREQGLLTLKRALPAPRGSYLLAKLLMTMLFAFVVMATMIPAALLLGHLHLTFAQCVSVTAINVLGSLPFCAIGLFIGTRASGKAAVAFVNLIYVPMMHISGLFYPLPKSALIPVTVLWLGFGDGSKILLIFLGCMIPVTIGAYNGARGADHALVWSARSMGASHVRLMWDVVMPSALPELLNGIRTALALAFILLVSSELIVSQRGFGYLIGYLGSTGSYEGMYAVVLTVAFLGFAVDRLYQLLMQRLLRWRD